MKNGIKKKNACHYIGQVCGILAIIACIVTLALSVTDSFIAIYTLAASIVFLGINRIFMHINSYKKNVVENIVVTVLIFVLAILVTLTNVNIYFLISSMFGYSLTIVLYCVSKMRNEKSVQNNVLCSLLIVLSFLFSFVFFFPAIYAKHASTVSNSNFIVLCFTVMILVSSSKNIFSSFLRKPVSDVIPNVIKKSLAKEILAALLILVILCSVYFTLVEQNIASYVDALWYSFAVITTIGFGDVSVSTTLGRILSVILGISGIAVVALFTSLIVNFYNEVSKKREERTLKKIAKEVEKIESSQEESQERNQEPKND